MEHIIIIGGSGFIGKNLVVFLSHYYLITVIDKYIDNDFFSKHPEIATIKVELDKEQIPQEVASPDYIINLASIVTADRNMALFDEMISSNLKVLINLYERYKDDENLKLFVQFGSSEEYGNICSPFKESMREHPCSPYALVKQLTVNTALMLFSNYGFPSMVVRPSNLFGKYQNSTKFIQYVIMHLKANDTLNVTRCEQKRDFIYVNDFAWCIKQLIQNYQKTIGEIVNIGSGSCVSLKEIIEECKCLLGSSSFVNYGALQYRENEIMELACDICKFERIIGRKVSFDIKKQLKTYLLEYDYE